jgi:glycosyltransferase 2 family protein
MNRARLRWLANWAGRLIAVAAVVFIVLALRRQWSEISARSLAPATWLAVVGLGIGYGTAMLLVAEAWHRLICDFARSPLPRRLTLPSYAVSQPFKYVPGNVFQYLGRHGWMMRAGVANMPLLKAMTWDIVLLLVAAVLFGVIAFLTFPMPIAFLSEALLRGLALGIVALFIVAAISLAISPRLQNRFGTLRPRLATVAVVVPLLMVFFALQGVIFAVLGSVIAGQPVPQLATVAVAAWIAGVLPLGTPGGLGTREAMVLLLAGPLLGQPDALLLAGLFRLVTIIGDATCAGIGWGIARTTGADDSGQSPA